MRSAADATPLDSTFEEFLTSLRAIVPPERIYTDPLRTLAWGTDAGFYRLVPRIVIRSGSEEELSSILSLAKSRNLRVTFRAAGTSLSGQAVSDSILIVAGKNWEKYSYDPASSRITLQPGIVGERVNAILSRWGRRFGPDPASIGSCMVGGIVMNNASGMSCGIHANSDRMLTGMRIVLVDGTVLDTASPQSRREFRHSHPEIVEGIEELRDEIQRTPSLSSLIRYKYSIKNVTGLNLLPFIKYSDPFDIIAHLMVGSEGTLAFMSEVTMDTLPVLPYRASAMIYFPTIVEAASGVVAMKAKKINITAAELLDKRSLASVGDPVYLEALSKDPDGCDLTAVLTEVQAETETELRSLIRQVKGALKPFGVKVEFTSDPAVYGKYWAIRSGIFPMVGGMRKEGTTCLIEDVAFHLEDLPRATADLSALLDRHGYTDSCIYGHALEGNFHFIINQSFSTPEEVNRYEDMIRDVAKIVVEKYRGSLKAEHGTGRNMAPFVEYEWGKEAFSVMKRVKALFDPDNLLNPGVIFNDDPKCFIRDFKSLSIIKPATSDHGPELLATYTALNKCIECGFCEVNCLSCGFTLSSRTRIVARREIARLQERGEDSPRLRSLLREYLYYGDTTCAGDGLCSTSCPMGINVADLTHQLRGERMHPGTLSYATGKAAASHFALTKNLVRGTLRMASLGRKVLGEKGMSSFGRGLHKMGVPLWTPSMPGPYHVGSSFVGKCNEVSSGSESPLKVVYFPSCINQTMGPARHTPYTRPLVEEMTDLLHKAGYEVIFPEGMEHLCCGTIWESKGMKEVADRKLSELEEALWKASEGGKYPVICDQSPCLHRMKKGISRMKLYECAEFIQEFLLGRLRIERTAEKISVHVTCSMRLMGKADTIVSLARMCSSDVVVPEGVGCCGFAGDKGMMNPELNAYALRKLQDQVQDVAVGYSNSRTCEIGLWTNSGVPYVSIVYLVNSHARAID